MKLHENIDEFRALVTLTADHFKIRETFIEKDYWVTYALKNLSKSEHKDKVVFKGGTSLSKVHKTIKRFSEDVDLAYVDSDKSRCQEIFSKIDKSIMLEPLKYKEMPGIEKKGPKKFRKTFYEYPKNLETSDMGYANENIILEINSFTKPEPSTSCEVNTYISEFLEEQKNYEAIKEFKLESFEIEVLNKEKTLAEKLCGLAKYTNKAGDTEFDFLKEKIRHLYDVSKLLDDDEIKSKVEDESIFKHVVTTREEDKENFSGSTWTTRKFTDAKIYTDTKTVLDKIKDVYNNDFSDLLYGSEKLPDLDYIEEQLKNISQKMLNLDE